MTITKLENPWDAITSIYDFQFFNCPSCSYKNDSKQDFVYHSFENHPESVQSLKRISDRCLNDILLPWDYKIEVENGNITENIKIECEAVVGGNTELPSTDAHQVKDEDQNHEWSAFIDPLDTEIYSDTEEKTDSQQDCTKVNKAEEHPKPTTRLKCAWFKKKVPRVWEHLNESIQFS